MTLLIVVMLLVLILLYGVSTYNKMFRNRNFVYEAWSTIDVFLKKRYDLITNLVDIVKVYASHEKDTLTDVIRMRNVAMASGGNSEDRIKNEVNLSGALDRLLVSVERYPELKENTNFLMLQNQLTELESDVEQSHRYYNGTVRVNNILVESFPSNIVANMGHFEKQAYFEIDEKPREVPNVSF